MEMVNVVRKIRPSLQIDSRQFSSLENRFFVRLPCQWWICLVFSDWFFPIFSHQLDTIILELLVAATLNTCFWSFIKIWLVKLSSFPHPDSSFSSLSTCLHLAFWLLLSSSSSSSSSSSKNTPSNTAYVSQSTSGLGRGVRQKNWAAWQINGRVVFELSNFWRRENGDRAFDRICRFYAADRAETVKGWGAEFNAVKMIFWEFYHGSVAKVEGQAA